MEWIYRGIFWVPFVLTIGIFLVLLYLAYFKRGIKAEQAREASTALLIIFAAQSIFKILFFYFYVKASELGQYLLKQPGYLGRNIWHIVQSYLGNILVAAIFLLIALIAQKISKKTFFTKSDFWIIFITAFVAGFPGVFVMIILALLLMILVQLFVIFVFKQNKRLDLVPFLLVSAIAVGILSSFSFYIHFLQNLHLI